MYSYYMIIHITLLYIKSMFIYNRLGTLKCVFFIFSTHFLLPPLVMHVREKVSCAKKNDDCFLLIILTSVSYLKSFSTLIIGERNLKSSDTIVP